MHNLFGANAVALKTTSRDELAAFLGQAVPAKQPLVAATGDATIQALESANKVPAGSDQWYVESHAYTVVAYDPSTRTVTLRNPWGHHPDPDGTFTLPLAAFTESFEVIHTIAN
jgi:hypothetical protein